MNEDHFYESEGDVILQQVWTVTLHHKKMRLSRKEMFSSKLSTKLYSLEKL